MKIRLVTAKIAEVPSRAWPKIIHINLIKACYVTSFWLLKLQSSGISLTSRLGTHSSIILSHLSLAWSEQTRKPEPTRPELRQPPKRLSARPRRVHIRGVPVKRSTQDGPCCQKLQGSNMPDRPSQPTIPECVTESQMTVALWTRLLSTLIPQGSPAKRQAVEIPVRWYT